MWNHAWKLTLTVAIAVGGYFGFAPGSNESQKSEQPTNSSPNSTTGIQGGVNIHNYSPQPSVPQPIAQSAQENSSDTEKTIPSITGDGNVVGDGNVIGDGNTVDNSRQTTNIEEQINTERNIQTEQYNENNGSGIANCNDTSDSCVENLTIEGN